MVACWLLAGSLLVWAAYGPAAQAAGVTPALPVTVFDLTGATASAGAGWLNPAATTELERPVVSGWVTAAADGTAAGRPQPVYHLALLDPGTGISGGLTGCFSQGSGAAGEAEPAQGELLQLGYTLAGRVGPVAVGVRANWGRLITPVRAAQELWTGDAGVRVELLPWLSAGGSVSNIQLASGTPEAGSWVGLQHGRAGITVAFPGPADGPPAGPASMSTARPFISLGWEDSRLGTDGGEHVVASGRLAAGLPAALDAALAYDLRTPGLAYWSVGLVWYGPSFSIEAGYGSESVYRAGVNLGL